MATEFDTIRGIEWREIDRLSAHLDALDNDGWLEQSYCAEWRVYQVASHLASGARLFLGSLAEWFDGAPAVTQEQRQQVWGHFDALEPGQMHGEFRSAIRDYFARLDALPSESGLKVVQSFLGTVPAQAMLTMRLHEVVLHTWDILVARDRWARLPDDAVELLLPLQFQFRTMRTPAALAGKRVRVGTPDGRWRRLLDFRGEKPVVTEDASADAELIVEAPAEELCRLLGGRHFLPGSLPRLTRQGGSYQELVALNLFAG
jgi:uncharacterized protein (TIGR03083 family)